MLEERINDRAFLRLIQKWLKAGILDTSGEVIHPATGTPQGGIVSPILANVYLHYALDLWFEKRVKRACNGEALIIRRRTSRKKLRASIAAFTEWIKTNRNKKISKLMTTLRAKYRGYWNYYGVIGNYGSLKTFYYRTRRILFKWLNRRSQRLSYNWAGFEDLLNQFLMPAPKITEKYPSKQLKLFV